MSLGFRERKEKLLLKKQLVFYEKQPEFCLISIKK